MKTKQFCAVIQDGNRITVFYTASIHGSFGAFLADMTGHRDAEPESLSVELQGHFIPIY